VVTLKPERLKRYKDIVVLLVKYGRSDLVRQARLDESLELDEVDSEVAPHAEELASDLERLGPTFIKLGQLLSTRGDLFPTPYLDALSRLQDQIEPFPYEDVEQIVSSELGVRISKAFSEFEIKPLAAASLAQVHRAVLRDGREVVVKVQRPDIREQIVGDLEALNEVAQFLDLHTELGKRYEFENMLLDLRKSLLRELDFKLEATNLTTIADNLAEFENIVVPRPVDDFTTSRVLTMDYIEGRKITTMSPLRLIEIDGPALAQELFDAYQKQMLIDGFFHADPHPGNVFVTNDGCLALLDLGMVGRIQGDFQNRLLRLLIAISDGRGDDAAAISILMGQPKEKFDEVEFNHRVNDLVSENSDTTVSRIQAGAVTLEIARIAADCWFRLAPEFTMIAKTLMNLDQCVMTLDPSFNPNAAIRIRASEILQRNLIKSIAPGNLINNAAEVKEFVEKLPARLNKILDTVGNNKLSIDVNAIDEKVLLDGLQKVANRITLGLVVAALIVGAAMLMRVETSFRIFGYPGLAMILFILAAAAGVMLIVSITFTDEKPDKK
jgi:predicted unusual protein kinase regulating ubiquinone biosynthesis (AarF/ABC1/UbiB family)